MAKDQLQVESVRVPLPAEQAPAFSLALQDIWGLISLLSEEGERALSGALESSQDCEGAGAAEG